LEPDIKTIAVRDYAGDIAAYKSCALKVQIVQAICQSNEFGQVFGCGISLGLVFIVENRGGG